MELLQKAAISLSLANYVILLFVAMALFACITLVRRTQLARPLCIANIVLFGVTAILIAVSAYLYMGDKDNYLLVDIATAAYVVATLCTAIYLILISTRSNKGRCVAAAILSLIPPVGNIATIVVAAKYKKDSMAQDFILSGEAITFAAIGMYLDAFIADTFEDGQPTDFPTLSAKELKSKNKEMKKGAKNAHGRAMYGEFLYRYSRSEWDKAFKLIKKAATENDSDALFRLGYFHENGICTKPDRAAAKKLYQQAAQGGNQYANLRLGILEAKEGNNEAAQAVFNAESLRGSPYGAYNTGYCYESGLGVPQSTKEAITNYTGAAERNCAAAQKRLVCLACAYIMKDKRIPIEDYDVRALQTWSEQSRCVAVRCIISGILRVRDRDVKSAAEILNRGIICRGAWESVARTLVGTLYMDCGATVTDRKNGLAYVKSAADMEDYVAREIYETARNLNIVNRKKPRKEKKKSDMSLNKKKSNDSVDADDFSHQLSAPPIEELGVGLSATGEEEPEIISDSFN